MIIKNANVYTADGGFVKKDVFVSSDSIVESIEELSEDEKKDVTDASGMYLIPGLTDIHFHGCMGADFSDGTIEAVEVIAAYQASAGVTTIVPATMTVAEKDLLNVCRSVREYREAQVEGQAILWGIHLEGPFLSKKKAGAQNTAFIRKPDAELLRLLQDESGGCIRICSVAPEEEGALELIRDESGEMIFSLAHTTADYDTACNAFEAGACQVTHLFNAMPAFSHRAPGVIGAAMDYGADAELICDGIHVHPSAVRSALKLFGEDHIIFVSDSIRATGLSDGTYLLGGLEVSVKGKEALLEDGTIAGSVTNLMDCMRVAVKEMGIPLETAVKCAAVNPAKRIGIFEKCGSIAAGKWANLVLLKEEDLSTTGVWVKGKRVV